MRSNKSAGGLTREMVWMKSRDMCGCNLFKRVQVNEALQEYTSASYYTNDQHNDISLARQDRHTRDTRKVLEYLQSKTPFDANDSRLHSIDTGVIASCSVNADKGSHVEKKTVDGLVGQKVQEYVFKRKDQAVALEVKDAVHTGAETVVIDPMLLFQRLVSAGTFKGELLDEVFTHELCSYPLALFKTTNVLPSPNKAALADTMWKQVPAMRSPATPAQYVLDGYVLLHRILWPSDEKFDAICSRYVHYVLDKYRLPVIVFDGYQNGPSTEDNTHSRRTKSSMAAEVRFTGEITCSMKEAVFFFNKTNKQRFITLLSSHLQQNNSVVIDVEADADVLVVQTAIESAASNDTVLVGNNTDLLVLLCCNSKSTNCELYLRPEPTSNLQRATGTLIRYKECLVIRSVTIFFSLMHCWVVIPPLKCLVLVSRRL